VRVGLVAAACFAACLSAPGLAGCGGGSEQAPGAAPAPGSDELTELRSLEPLQAAFAADAGRARVVLLVSPT
jgi:hypothetical protein